MKSEYIELNRDVLTLEGFTFLKTIPGNLEDTIQSHQNLVEKIFQESVGLVKSKIKLTYAYNPKQEIVKGYISVYIKGNH